MANDLGLFADSLGWALLHSIWQIALVSALVFGAMRLVSKDNPGLRYAIAYSGLLSTLIAFFVTFGVYYQALDAPIAATGTEAAAQTGVAALIAMLGKTTGLVSLLWAAGFAVLASRYVRALRATYRLRHEGVSAVPQSWEKRFELWIARLGADRDTIIRESDRVSTPLTIGMLKPIVLVPTGFFLHLPSDQAEAILVHEIAHICRQDYLAGLVQTMITNIFFFHPGVYLLARQIDIEREYACDARAVAETGDATALARGLSRIALERRAGARHGFAIAADGRRTPVMDRINRLADRPDACDEGAGVPLAAIAALFATCLMIAAGADASVRPASGPAKLAPQPPGTEALLPGKSGIPSEPGSETVETAITDPTTNIADPATMPTHTAALAIPHAVAVARAPAAIAAPVPPTAVSFARSEPQAKGGARWQFAVATANEAMTRSAVRWAVHEIDDENCEEEIARRGERIARNSARNAERAAAAAERQAERIEREVERHAVRVEREAERMQQRFEQMAEQIEARAERAAGQAERAREFHRERLERDAEGRAQRLVISYTTQNLDPTGQLDDVNIAIAAVSTL